MSNSSRRAPWNEYSSPRNEYSEYSMTLRTEGGNPKCAAVPHPNPLIYRLKLLLFASSEGKNEPQHPWLRQEAVESLEQKPNYSEECLCLILPSKTSPQQPQGAAFSNSSGRPNVSFPLSPTPREARQSSSEAHRKCHGPPQDKYIFLCNLNGNQGAVFSD